MFAIVSFISVTSCSRVATLSVSINTDFASSSVLSLLLITIIALLDTKQLSLDNVCDVLRLFLDC